MTPMILLCGKFSSNSLIESGRPMLKGTTVPGNRTRLRKGRMGSTSGIFGSPGSSGLEAAADGAGSGSSGRLPAGGDCFKAAREFIKSHRILRLRGRWQGEVNPQHAVALLGLHILRRYFHGQ